MVEFKFELEKLYMTFLEDVSVYNSCYYKLDLSKYGDYIIPGKCDILHLRCEDDYPWSYYTLGYFEKDSNKFVECFTWLGDYVDLDFVKRGTLFTTTNE